MHTAEVLIHGSKMRGHGTSIEIPVFVQEVMSVHFSTTYRYRNNMQYTKTKYVGYHQYWSPISRHQNIPCQEVQKKIGKTHTK